MANFKIQFSFLGQKFQGSCMQPNQRTVQGCLKQALIDLFQINTKIYMCSRLDKGVHAKQMVANFFLDKDIEPTKLLTALNAKLKPDLQIDNCEIVNPHFNSLFDAKGKHYQYVIYNHPTTSVFLNDFAWQIKQPINLDKLIEVSKIFLGKHDFASFGTNKMGTTIRTINEIKITSQNNFIYIDIFGPGFLKNMVRMLVAAMINYALDKLDISTIHNYLIYPQKGSANDLAPAGGLYLIHVYY